MDVQGTCILLGNKEFIVGIYIPLIQGLFVEPRNSKLMLTPRAKKMKGTSVKWGKHWQYLWLQAGRDEVCSTDHIKQ